MNQERQKTDAIADAVEIPEGATHIKNGNYYRKEGDKVRVFHICGGECLAWNGGNCKEKNKWSRYTSGNIDETYKPL